MEFFTVEEAAKLLKVDPKTVYRLINSGALKAAAVGRVYRIEGADIIDYIRESKIKVQSSKKKNY